MENMDYKIELDRVETQIARLRNQIDLEEDQYEEQRKKLIHRQETLSDMLHKTVQLITQRYEMAYNWAKKHRNEAVSYHMQTYLTQLDQLTIDAHHAFSRHNNALEDELYQLERTHYYTTEKNEAKLYQLYYSRRDLEEQIRH